MQTRLHLLTEENNVLMEQHQLSLSELETVRKDYAHRTRECWFKNPQTILLSIRIGYQLKQEGQSIRDQHRSVVSDHEALVQAKTQLEDELVRAHKDLATLEREESAHRADLKKVQLDLTMARQQVNELKK